MKDPMVNTILIFDLHMINKPMNNNFIIKGLGI